MSVSAHVNQAELSPVTGGLLFPAAGVGGVGAGGALKAAKPGSVTDRKSTSNCLIQCKKYKIDHSNYIVKRKTL